MSTPPYIFFGTSAFSLFCLDALAERNMLPVHIVTAPPQPKGRGLTLTPNPVELWAREHHIPVSTFAKLDDTAFTTLSTLTAEHAVQFFLVASYGHIIPDRFIHLPPHRTLNIHPSLLPQWRGPAPIPAAIMADDKNIGVCIMEIDAQMDHGPIIASKALSVEEWPTTLELKKTLGTMGVQLLADNIHAWLAGTLKATPQNHEAATYSKKFTKADGEIQLTDDPYKIFRTFQAYSVWPSVYFFLPRSGRIKITALTYDRATHRLHIQRVIPEGKKEMSAAQFFAAAQQRGEIVLPPTMVLE
jgi:methionyl-tRNA formyltransferase